MGEAEYIRGFLILSAGVILFYIVLEYFKDQNNVEEEDTFTNLIAEEQYNSQLPIPQPSDSFDTDNPSNNKHVATVQPISSDDSEYKPINYEQTKLPNDCFPKDKLTAEDLLPKDAANSKWAQVNPAGQGELKNHNFLTAGYHVGINTVGSTLRNANMQLRSEPPNPQMKVSPWNQTTINPDLNRRPLEINGCE